MPGDPHSGSKIWKAADREISKPGENRGKVIAHRDLQPTAAFHEREYRRNLRSRFWAADVQPILWFQQRLISSSPIPDSSGVVSNDILRNEMFIRRESDSLCQSISLLAMAGFFGSDACDLRRLPFFNSR